MAQRPKMTQLEAELLDAERREREAVNDPLFRALYGDSTTPLPRASGVKALPTDEAEKLQKEHEEEKKQRDEQKRKYYNLRENEREMLDQFDKATYTGRYFDKEHKAPVCEKLIGDWWEVADYGFIFGPRGSGKSYFVLALCKALISGQMIAEWRVPKQASVMYVDGEMSQKDLQIRVRGLDLTDGKFLLINHDAFFRETGKIFSLSEEKDQNALLQHCYNLGVKVLVLDNLSALFRGVEENSADEWEKILTWLLKCRRYGLSVILIHHSGKNGDQRGTSRREDAAAWSIKLNPIREGLADGEMKFNMLFSKPSRHCQSPKPMEWTFRIPENGLTTYSTKDSGEEEIVLDLIRQGVDNNGDIADHLGISRAQVTKIFHKLEAAGLTYKDGHKYKAGKAKKDEGAVEVNAPPIEDAVIAAVKMAGRPLCTAEIRDELKTGTQWSDANVRKAIHKLVKTGRLSSAEIPNPNPGNGQHKIISAYQIPS